jgi:hypothetical protein
MSPGKTKTIFVFSNLCQKLLGETNIGLCPTLICALELNHYQQPSLGADT